MPTDAAHPSDAVRLETVVRKVATLLCARRRRGSHEVRRFLSLAVPCLALAVAVPPAAGCGGSNGTANGNDAGTSVADGGWSGPDGDGSADSRVASGGDTGGGATLDTGAADGDDAGGGSSPAHALGTVLLAESHAPGDGGVLPPVVSASFLPDAALVPPTCSSPIAGCDFVAGPDCGANGCDASSTCGWDSACHPTCTASCDLSCGSGWQCYFSSSGQPGCRPYESFDAGILTFIGAATGITLAPPYAYQGGPGAPFVPGSQLEVKASGALGAGFDAFDETFTATTFVQTSPSLDSIATATVFGAGSVPIGWVPGSDAVKITVAGGGGVATCVASDPSGHFDVPRAVITAALGSSGAALVAIGVTRERDEWRKDASTRGSLSTEKVQPVGWLELTTTSTETYSFQGQGCPTAGQTMCPDGCFDTSSDSYHCGSCTTVCAPTQSCQGGQCTP
jgi:hypothetical protein